MITYRYWFHTLLDDPLQSLVDTYRALRSSTVTTLRHHFPHGERLTRIFICTLLLLILVLFLPFLHWAESAANTAAFLGPAYGALVGFSALVIGVLLDRLEGRAHARREHRRQQVKSAHAIRMELVEVLAARRSYLDVMEKLEPSAPVTRKLLYNHENLRDQRERPHRQFMDQIGGFPLQLASSIHAAYAEIRNTSDFEQFMSACHKPNSMAPEEERAEQFKSVRRTLQRCGKAVDDLDKWILANHAD